MAGTRLSGLISGMDTESIISQLVDAKKVNVNKTKKKQISLNYKQDAWKSLNSKLKSLQQKYVSNLRFSSSYAKKTTKVSNSSAVSVITGGGAVNGVQSLEVKQLAKTGYLTGAKLGDGKQDFTALSTMEDLGMEFDTTGQGSFKVKAGSKSVDVDFTASTTISDVLTKMKEAGLNASFDAKNQRFFVSSKESGKANDFSITANDANGAKALDALGLTKQAGATKIDGQDAKILLNDAEFENTTNSFEINGLTITALSETKPGEAVTLTTQDDTEGIYDMVRNFINEYNSVINELDKLYNADSITLEPLLQEEKDALSETEVKDVEEKLRGSVLRRDSNINSIASALKDAMSATYEVNGKKMGLFDFGINTLSYFAAPDNEKNAFHIDGDDKDENTAGNADKLKSMISSDPNAVISFFTQLGQKLYSNMSDQSKSVEGYRTYGSFYDDKRMKTDYTDFNTKISDMEKKLNDYEDKWYAKFAKMEKAMAKMQSNTSGVTALLGGQY